MSRAGILDINDEDLASDLYQNFTDGDPYAVKCTAATADDPANAAEENFSDSSSDGEVDECKINFKIRKLEWKLEKSRKKLRLRWLQHLILLALTEKKKKGILYLWHLVLFLSQ